MKNNSVVNSSAQRWNLAHKHSISLPNSFSSEHIRDLRDEPMRWLRGVQLEAKEPSPSPEASEGVYKERHLKLAVWT